jgi:hypothetical protein
MSAFISLGMPGELHSVVLARVRYALLVSLVSCKLHMLLRRQYRKTYRQRQRQNRIQF